MMDRGSFNGPGGPHMRWVVHPIAGGAMPAGLMLRNRMVNGFIAEEDPVSMSVLNKSQGSVINCRLLSGLKQ